MVLAQTYVVAFDASQTQQTQSNSQTQTYPTPLAQSTTSSSTSTSTTTTTSTSLSSTEWALIIGAVLVAIALIIGLAMRNRGDSTTVIR
jgi:hypothetical protein